jgi:hypothetical protein
MQHTPVGQLASTPLSQTFTPTGILFLNIFKRCSFNCAGHIALNKRMDVNDKFEVT